MLVCLLEFNQKPFSSKRSAGRGTRGGLAWPYDLEVSRGSLAPPLDQRALCLPVTSDPTKRGHASSNARSPPAQAPGWPRN